ncbi:hypothetical protein [Acidobacterium sp. S8]
MGSTTKLEIVTPEAVVYSEDVNMVTLPCVEGIRGLFSNCHFWQYEARP